MVIWSIQLPSLERRIDRYRVILSIDGSRKPRRREAVANNQDANQRRGPSRRELPVRGHLRAVNGNIVGMSFNAQPVGANRQDGSNTINRGQRFRLDGCRSTVEESKVLQAHDQTIGLAV